MSFFFSIEQNDPALNSAEIEKVLIENEREANIKTEKVGWKFRGFALTELSHVYKGQYDQFND